MKRTHYPIHPDFKKYESFNPPLNPIVLRIMQNLMKLLVHQEKSDSSINVSKFKVPVEGTNINALLYSPKEIKENAPCLIYYHGGGFVLPAAPSYYHWAREYARSVNCHVLLVDYRLAPKYPFPTPTEDSFKAYQWLLSKTTELSINPLKIAVGGDSAGGEIATVMTLMALDHSVQIPCAQLLIYPVTAHKLQTPSMKEFVDTPLCNSEDMKKYENYYAPNEHASKWEYLSPIESDQLEHMPITYLETAEFDCLRDCGIKYAEKLESLGVKTTLNKTKGTIHGFDIAVDSLFVKDVVEQRVEFLRKVLNDE